MLSRYPQKALLRTKKLNGFLKLMVGSLKSMDSTSEILFISKAINEKLTLGMAFRAESPRKFGCIGTHPTDGFAAAYGDRG